MNKTIALILLLIPSLAFGQENKEFESFIKLFPKISLPTTINYSESEFKTEYYTPEEATVKKDSIPYHDHVLPKDSSLMLKKTLVKLYLLADKESVTPLYPSKNSTSDTIYPTYYISNQLSTNKTFICLIYEKQFVFNGNTNAEKYLCTITKKGKLIDKMLVASANYSGTGILTEGFRVPWFPDTKSEINSDLYIVFKDANDGAFTYYINDIGKIIIGKK